MKPMKKSRSGVELHGECELCGSDNGDMLIQEVIDENGGKHYYCSAHSIEKDPESLEKSKQGVEDKSRFDTWFTNLFSS